MTVARPCLDIVICGAGIAGLAAACALAPQHNVTVLERKDAVEEVAYAINLKPNAAKAAFGVVGLDPARVKGNPCLEIVERSAKDGEVRMHKAVDAPADFGGPWYFCQRTQLHAELLQTAKQRSATVVLGAQVDEIVLGDANTPASVAIHGAPKMTADLVLIADGIGSRLRPKLLQDGVDYRWDSGQVAYRAFVPVELLKGHASLEWLTNPQAGGLYVWADQKQRVVVYPCPGHVNIVAIVDKDHLKVTGAADRPRKAADAATADEMRAQFDDFDVVSRELLSVAPDASLWPLHDVAPLPFYERGRGILIGDAAHATLPHQGQGASLAFEDAEGLSHLIARQATASSQVPAMLADFTRLRRERVHAIQYFSRVMAKPASYEKGEKLDALRFAGKTLTYRGIAELLPEDSVRQEHAPTASVPVSATRA